MVVGETRGVAWPHPQQSPIQQAQDSEACHQTGDGPGRGGREGTLQEKRWHREDEAGDQETTPGRHGSDQSESLGQPSQGRVNHFTIAHGNSPAVSRALFVCQREGYQGPRDGRFAMKRMRLLRIEPTPTRRQLTQRAE